MFYNLALSNAKKSLKDYTIYFLTLTFGVCMFYVFNSIESQKSMMVLSESQYEIMDSLTRMINGVSVFVAVVLGFLIIYANNFLIKRRKKELGLYMTLGMEKGKISKILVIETFIISLGSLGIGLLVGIFASQGLSIITAMLFEVDLKDFHFVVSDLAILKSIGYFGLIFLIVMLFNVWVVSRYKLIELLNAHRRSERLKIKNIRVSAYLFIVSLLCLGFAYRCIIHNGMLALNLEFAFAIILGIIGTLLFFFSLSGFLLQVIQKNKKFYYKGLNVFVLRQINSKINTTYISMSIISIMLLITIGTLASGLGVANVMTESLKTVTPFDVSFVVGGNESGDGNIKPVEVNITQLMGSKLDDIAKNYIEYSVYELPITMGQLVTHLDKRMKTQPFMTEWLHHGVDGIKLSDYNRIRTMEGEQPISLNDNQYALICNYSMIKDYYRLSDIQTLEIGGQNYELYGKDFQDTQLETSSAQSNAGTIILPDDKITNEVVTREILNINYKKANEDYEKQFNDEVLSNTNLEIGYSYITKQDIYQNNVGVKVLVSYLAIYIGLVFLIACVAILALQQLSESSDNIERYKLLRKLGVEEKMINRALFWQVFIYFMMPLVLAIIHSIVGLYVVNRLIQMVGQLDILNNIIYTTIIVLIIYGAYFIATYMGCKSMIRASK